MTDVRTEPLTPEEIATYNEQHPDRPLLTAADGVACQYAALQRFGTALDARGLPGGDGARAEARRIQEHWLAGRRDQAVACVPDEYLEQTAFIGDEQRIRRRWASWSPPPLSTGLIVDVPGVEELRLVANLRNGS